MITEVKVKDIDYSARYLYPSRIIEIKTKGQDIFTPMRAATAYEYNEKAKVPTEITIDNPVSVSVENLNNIRFEKFLKTNTYFSKLMRKIELYNRLLQYSDLKLFLLKPTTTPKKDPKTKEIIIDSPMTILKHHTNIREKFLRFLIRLQLEIDLNPITIPFIDLPLQTFQNISLEIVKSLEKINREPLFFIDIKYKEFEPAIDWLVNHLESKAIGLYYRPFRNFPLNYDVLSRYVDVDVAFITTQIRRYDPTHYDISTMHYLPFFGNDIYAVLKPPSYFNRRFGLSELQRDRLRSIRLFDRESLCLKQIRFASSTINKLEEKYRDDVVINSILKNYQEANEDADKLKILRAFTKINELKESTSEFIRFQEYVRQNSANDYIQQKNVLKRTLQEVTGAQTKLNNI